MKHLLEAVVKYANKVAHCDEGMLSDVTLSDSFPSIHSQELRQQVDKARLVTCIGADITS